MRSKIIIMVLLGCTFLNACDTCTTCEPFTEEPFVKVRFLSQVDSARRIIIIDSINSVAGTEVRQLQDTTYEFRFPLDMHHDSSSYQIVYRDTSKIEQFLSNTLILYYTRQLKKRDDNYVIVICSLQSLSSDFYNSELNCNENSTIECTSNEAVIKIYN